MQTLLDDLFDYSRTTLHVGITIRPTSADLGKICAQVIDEVRTSHPAQKVALEIAGDVSGVWDPKRLHQVLSNLVLNAVAHSSSREPVQVRVDGSDQEVTLSVFNGGDQISPKTLQTLFDPLRSGSVDGDGRPTGAHMGLGLFIAKEITKSHGGEIDVTSNERGTAFRVRLPRKSIAGA